jgi:hypothetical protein
MTKKSFSFRSWLLAVPLRAAVGAMLMIFVIGTISRILLHTESFLQNPLRDMGIGMMVSLLAAILTYWHARKLREKR